MKRKVGLFLLAVILAVTLGTALVVSSAMYRLVSARQAQEIHNVATSLSERFTIFEVMLRSQHGRVRAHMEQVLPLIAGDIAGLSVSPEQLSHAQMDALTTKYHIDHVYFIDRQHKVFQTNFTTDMDLQFPVGGLTRFLDTVYGQGRVMGAGIDISSRTGALNTYCYFGPAGRD